MFTLPILNIKANPLDALLAAVGYRLAMLAKSDDPNIAKILNDRKVSIELGSKADGVARYYVFDNGSFNQYSGSANNPSLRIDFKDSMTGVKLLTGGNVAAFMTAIQDKELVMEGDYSLLMWFNQLAKHIVPEIPAEVKPLLEKARPLAEKAQGVASQLIGMAKHKLSK
ncbi:hypothetical protein DLE54_10495 [Psychrobacter sp. YP14]|uniref:SCP2 domain-containing protein n=3 Tax=Psychrobacter TaxID=497 RepID=A0A844M251_9GAMM|nr:MULTISPECIES: hypothetical protein [Psychrobacter]AWT49889.1 hypothetical protein DLE54_10495 [Psychrobacter sp. YP14]MUG32688.1 hypothetical protein [Psychrobacter sanguinis]UNK05238.1 hypothetical protein MN210_15025 [Psychrobacter sp. PraFG1]